jgi:hypothetical protein
MLSPDRATFPASREELRWWAFCDNVPVPDEVPWSETLTDYDMVRLIVYLRLLDTEADGASTEQMARVLLGVDPAQDPDWAERTIASHLRRARWMTETGYRHLLRRPSGAPAVTRVH